MNEYEIRRAYVAAVSRLAGGEGEGPATKAGRPLVAPKPARRRTGSSYLAARVAGDELFLLATHICVTNDGCAGDRQ